MDVTPAARVRDGMPARPGRPNTSIDTSIRLGSVALNSPVLTASGCFGSGKEMHRFVDLDALGAVVCKTVTAQPRIGISPRRGAETPSGMLNAIGLQNPGVEAFRDNDLAWLAERSYPAIASVGGHSIDDYETCVAALNYAPIVAIELNLSCPNLEDRGFMFALDPIRCKEVVAKAVAASHVPIFAKLSPDVTDITAIAGAALDGGAAGLSLINTTLGLAIDVERRRPVLSTATGGLSGPAIKPIALRCVYLAAKAHPGVPIIGMGGISSGRDAAEFLLAGASAIAVGTTNFVDPSATARIFSELAAIAEKLGCSSIAELTGGAL
jgi:dihydroorotate dehydrogenase (NAD+) catalytic subunit